MKELIFYNMIAVALISSILFPLATADGHTYEAQKDAIYYAACDGGDKLRSVIAEGTNINSIDSHGNTALITAADHNKEEVVRLLVNNGANINIQNEAGETALMIAAEEGSIDIVCFLLDAEADPNIRDRKGQTALEKAEEAGYTETAGLIGRSGGK